MSTESAQGGRSTGLPGLAWDSGLPVFLPDLGKGSRFLRSESALQVGINRGLIGFSRATGDVGNSSTHAADVGGFVGVNSGYIFSSEATGQFGPVPLGGLTAPEVTRHGIEVFAICARNETKTDTPIRTKTREILMTKAFEKESKNYLRQLRRNALIEPGK